MAADRAVGSPVVADKAVGMAADRVAGSPVVADNVAVHRAAVGNLDCCLL